MFPVGRFLLCRLLSHIFRNFAPSHAWLLNAEIRFSLDLRSLRFVYVLANLGVCVTEQTDLIRKTFLEKFWNSTNWVLPNPKTGGCIARHDVDVHSIEIAVWWQCAFENVLFCALFTTVLFVWFFFQDRNKAVCEFLRKNLPAGSSFIEPEVRSKLCSFRFRHAQSKESWMCCRSLEDRHPNSQDSVLKPLSLHIAADVCRAQQ